MRKHEFYPTYQDLFEYYGNTEILRIRNQKGISSRQDWLIFDSVEEAMEYFNTNCGEPVVYYQ